MRFLAMLASWLICKARHRTGQSEQLGGGTWCYWCGRRLGDKGSRRPFWPHFIT